MKVGKGTVLQYSATPSLRTARIEDEDDDEDENEALCGLTSDLKLSTYNLKLITWTGSRLDRPDLDNSVLFPVLFVEELLTAHPNRMH